MKTRILLSVLLVISLAGFGQKVKQITKRFPNSKMIAEEYYVIRSNKKIKHGEYTSYNKSYATMVFNGDSVDFRVKQHGYFKNGKKEGAWIEKDANGREERGVYANGVRVGIWDTYKNCLKIGSYDHTLGRKIGTWVYMEDKQVVSHNYETGDIETKPMMSLTISYPRKAKEDNVQGIVTVQFHLTADCNIEDITIIKSLSPECDEAVIKALRNMGASMKRTGGCTDNTYTMGYNFKLMEN